MLSATVTGSTLLRLLVEIVTKIVAGCRKKKQFQQILPRRCRAKAKNSAGVAGLKQNVLCVRAKKINKPIPTKLPRRRRPQQKKTHRFKQKKKAIVAQNHAGCSMSTLRHQKRTSL